MNTAADMTPAVGITSRLPAEDYRALPGVSITRLKELKRSPKHYRYRLANPRTSAPMQLGTAAHCAVLEPERFGRQFAVWSRRGPAGKLCPRSGQYWEAFMDEAGAREVITEDECVAALAIGKAVRSDPIAMRYLESGEPEVTMQWAMSVDALAGSRVIACRGRADWLTRVDERPYLVGLKSANDCRPFIFGSAAAKLGYHLQWAFYFDGYEELTGVEPGMKEIVVESAPPHDVVVYDVPEDIILQGRAEYEALLRVLIDCEARDEWLGVANGTEQVLTLPTWAYDAQDDLSELGLEN